MPDMGVVFAGGSHSAGVIHSWDSNGLLEVGTCPSPSSAAYPSANRAQYFPFIIEQTVTAYQMGWLNGSTVNNTANDMDVGIYDYIGNRLVRQGGTITQTPVSVVQIADISDTVLTPGVYFMAINASNTTGHFLRMLLTNGIYMRMKGCQQQAVGAVGLPDPATFTANTTAYVPAMCVFLKSVG